MEDLWWTHYLEPRAHTHYTPACTMLLSSRSLFLLTASILAVVVNSEVQDFSILLPPTSTYVHYADGYLRGPDASINMQGLHFTAKTSSFEGYYDSTTTEGSPPTKIDDDGGGDDFVPVDQQHPDHEEDGDEPKEGQGPPLLLLRRLEDSRRRDTETMTFVDVAVFEEPSACASSRGGCDWTELGVGNRTGDEHRFCCNNEAVDLGLCEGGHAYGRLLITDKFRGQTRSMGIPAEGDFTTELDSSMGLFDFDDIGARGARVVVVFANCNDEGRGIQVTGTAVWKSAHGYLPGELYPFMYFYTVVTCIYAALFLWYLYLMKVNAASRIEIEKWILSTIVVGLLELSFKTADYYTWNDDGLRKSWLTYTGVLLGVFKNGVSRCLVVMVSLGWGVVTDTLGRTMYRIVLLGAIYVAVDGAAQFAVIFAVKDMQSLSYSEETELFDLATILTFIVAAVDVIFIMWILDSLSGTMMYLENMNQSRKLQRYLHLRTIFLISILFAAVWAIFALFDMYDQEGIVREEAEWIVQAATEVNYLFVLLGVAWLWRPNPAAKEYAYALELSSTDAENELELTETVPSAMDDDEGENPPDLNGSFHDERFQIDDGETA